MDDGGSSISEKVNLSVKASGVGDSAIDDDAEIFIGEGFEREQQRPRQERRDY